MPELRGHQGADSVGPLCQQVSAFREAIVEVVADRPRHQRQESPHQPPEWAQAAQDVHQAVRAQQQRSAAGLDDHRVRQLTAHFRWHGVLEDFASQWGEAKSLAGAVVLGDETDRPVADATIAIVEDTLGAGRR